MRFTTHNFPVTYKECEKLFTTPRNHKKTRIPVCNNTEITRYPIRDWDSNFIARYSIRLHGTVVLGITPDLLMWNTGNWNTRTTLQRINRALIPLGHRLHIKNNYLHLDGIKCEQINGIIVMPWPKQEVF
jgi:hypothetical protein